MKAFIFLPYFINNDTYFKVPKLENIKFSELIKIEEEISKVIKEIENMIKLLKSKNKSKIEFFIWDENFIKSKKINIIIKEIKTIKDCIKIKNDVSVKEKPKENKYSYIDSFVVKINIKKNEEILKIIENFVNINCIEIKNSNSEFIEYNIFVLKREKEKIIKNFKDKNIKIIEKEDFEEKKDEKENNYRILYNLYLHSLFLKGYIDSILRYGLPQDYLYKIIKQENKKELKIILNISKKLERIPLENEENEIPITIIEIKEI